MFAVYFFNAINKISLPKAKRIWNVCCRPGFGTWKDGKWMDVDIVDYTTQKVLKGNQHILFIGIGHVSNQKSRSQNQTQDMKDIELEEMLQK